MRRDLSYAVRMLIRQPGVTVLTIALLAVGIGGGIVMFALADGILWHPAPFRDADRLVHVRGYAPGQPNQIRVSAASLEAWTARDRILARVHTWAMGSAIVGPDDDPEAVTIARVSPGLISDLMDGSALRGRDFTRSDVGQRVVILSDALWHSRFHGARDAIGQTIAIDGDAYTIVGIAPTGFEFPVSRIGVWLPLGPASGSQQVGVIGWIRSDLTFDQAAALTESTTRGFNERRLPELRLVPLVQVAPETARAIYLLLAAAGCILVIAVANASNILLADYVRRAPEMALRQSLGAGRCDLVRQILVEAIMRAAIAAVAALAVAAWTLDVVLGGMPYLMTYQALRPITVDWRAALFAAIVALVAGCATALASLAYSVRRAVRAGIAHAVGAATPSRARSALTVLQVATTLVLLAAAGLLMNGFVRLMRVDVGFNPDGLRVISFTIPKSRLSDGAEVARALDRLRAEIAGRSDVVSASVTDGMPPHMGFQFGEALETSDGPSAAGASTFVSFAAVDSTFFATLGVPLVQGRSFDTRDTSSDERSAVISRALAAQLWPNRSAVGRRIRMSAADPWLTVVGVVGDVVNGGFDSPRGVLSVFTPRTTARPFQMLLVRTRHLSARFDADVRAIVHRTLPGAPVIDITSASEMIAGESTRVRFATFVLSALAILALGLAFVGVYGAFWCATRQRTREFGVRLAIGAAPSQLTLMVLRDSGRVAVLGVALGLPAAFIASRSIRSLLFEVSPLDPPTIGGAVVVLCAAVVAAAYPPARRAGRLNPADVLRTD